ncbi:hypothetical protein CONPUDRAFT_161369 [Coniophora puteana RWD-64-598 SS2]|uniref:PHD-type domain-containing protein n=1 Tax=Coniophora puteana (strain RWD-64-598) TaxID=741705 RepID=A0A5M3N5I2_CONPW|nr:uncharacterized protein CONPUDRAFT_161369 [Coniophora puteana RWD-64-598 SS2]EIW86670.1 hypothetical protein CONPUDRAFT_161369 [Coniophora puteana RWD-64-598 SS2]
MYTSPPPASRPVKPRSYIGLEALVHAASEERRRISGSTHDSASDRGSPVADRALPHRSHHEHYQASTLSPGATSYPPFPHRVEHPRVQDVEERPHKRLRPSQSPDTSSRQDYYTASQFHHDPSGTFTHSPSALVNDPRAVPDRLLATQAHTHGKLSVGLTSVSHHTSSIMNHQSPIIQSPYSPERRALLDSRTSPFQAPPVHTSSFPESPGQYTMYQSTMRNTPPNRSPVHVRPLSIERSIHGYTSPFSPHDVRAPSHPASPTTPSVFSQDMSRPPISQDTSSSQLRPSSNLRASHSPIVQRPSSAEKSEKPRSLGSQPSSYRRSSLAGILQPPVSPPTRLTPSTSSPHGADDAIHDIHRETSLSAVRQLPPLGQNMKAMESNRDTAYSQYDDVISSVAIGRPPSRHELEFLVREPPHSLATADRTPSSFDQPMPESPKPLSADTSGMLRETLDHQLNFEVPGPHQSSGVAERRGHPWDVTHQTVSGHHSQIDETSSGRLNHSQPDQLPHLALTQVAATHGTGLNIQRDVVGHERLKPKSPEFSKRTENEVDAHEWLLSHYADGTSTPDRHPNRPTVPEHPQRRSPSNGSQAASRGLGNARHGKQNRLPATPVTTEAVDVLEQELEIAADATIPRRKLSPDLSKEHGSQAFHASHAHGQAARMKKSNLGLADADVEDELLSLVDDTPLERRRLSKSKVPELLSGDTQTAPGGDVATPSVAPPSPDPSFLRITTPPIEFANKEPNIQSMPPTKVKRTGEKSTGTKKRKETNAKVSLKQKAPPKSRPKPSGKGRVKSAPDTASAKDSIKPTLVAQLSSRSRSVSMMPGELPDENGEAAQDDPDEDKLYCICKTHYDEDRVMIACDRCDEWYHTQCVKMPDLEVDLVDQFICPICIDKYPDLHLRTTYKRRCQNGLQHPDPSSPDACHKPSRGAFSKYCSDDCGVECMQARMAELDKTGSRLETFWETVKNAEKREGVVVCAFDRNCQQPSVKMEVDDDQKQPIVLVPPRQRRVERKVAKLNQRLTAVVRERDAIKQAMDVILWRENIVELASSRADRVDQCGWDQRLCFGEEEWEDFGAEVLESYEERDHSGEHETQVDSGSSSHGEWWCTGRKKCDRHSGWQKLRAGEVAFDKETKESALSNLTTREREIRKAIEDILDPQARKIDQSVLTKPSHSTMNLHADGDTQVKGKKKKT